MTQWTPHDGKGLPVAPQTRVIVKFRDGLEELNPHQADWWGNGGISSNWNFEFPCDDDIVAYAVVASIH